VSGSFARFTLIEPVECSLLAGNYLPVKPIPESDDEIKSNIALMGSG
jgi:hypothetical protein